MCIDWFQWNIYIVHVYFYEAVSFLFKKKHYLNKVILTSKDFITMRVYLYK